MWGLLFRTLFRSLRLFRKDDQFNPMKYLGTLIFVVACGAPALEMTGFGHDRLEMSLWLALMLALTGGALGGALMCPTPYPAGIIGGAVAGVGGMLVLYWYSSGRMVLYRGEIALVQMAGSLPGIGIGFLLKKWLPDMPLESLWKEEESPRR